MRSQLNILVLMGAGLFVALLTVGAAINYRSLHSLREGGALVAHTHQVREGAAELARSLERVDALSRSQTAEGREEESAELTAAMSRSRLQWAQLVQLTDDNPRQQARLKLLDEGLAASGRLLDNLAEDGQSAPTRRRLQEELTSVIRDALATLADLRASESALLEDRVENVRRAFRFAVYSSVVKLLLGTLLVLAGIYLIRTSAKLQQSTLESLDQERELLEVTLNSIGDAVIATDTAGRVTLLNRIGSQMTGWDRLSAVGRPLQEVFRLEGEHLTSEPRNPLVQAIATGQVVRPDRGAVVVGLSGVRTPLAGSASVIRDAQGRTRGAVLAFRDISSELEAEREARERERQFRQLADAMPQIVWICRPDGDATFFNRKWGDYTGVALERSLGDLWTRLVHADDVDLTLSRWRHAVATGDPYETECRIRSRRGGYRWFLARALPVRGPEGAVVRWFGTCTDIDDTRRVQGELAAAKEFLKSSIDALASHIAVLDHTGRVLAVNEAWRRFARENGLTSPDAGVGMNYLDVCDREPGGSREAAEVIRLVLAGDQERAVLEYPCHGPHHKRWFQMRVTSFLSGGEPRVVVAHEDITARVLASKAANRRTGQLRVVADLALQLNASDGVESVLHLAVHNARRILGAHYAATDGVLMDEDGCTEVDSLSVAWEERLSADARRKLACLTTDLELPPTAGRRSADELRDVPAWRELEALIGRNRLRAGVISAALVGRDGDAHGVLFLIGKQRGELFTDDDEAVLVQIAQMASVALEKARLVRERTLANTRKDQFLATLAHELRNPLASLHAAAELLCDPGTAADDRGRYARIALGQCTQLSRLIDDLLDVSRIATGKLQLRLERCDLRQSLETALEIARGAIELGGHTLTVRVSDSPIPVRGDQVRLAQVVANLLVNAAKYTPHGGRITLAAETEGERAVVVVEDNGVGIPPHLIDHVFDLFTQAENAPTMAQGGLGIGLTLVKTLVEMHQGEVAVHSEGAGRGACFTVRLPLEVSGPVHDSPHPAAEPQAPLRTFQCLVVDDNRAAAFLLGRLLEKLGQEVRTATSGDEALKLVESWRPDVVFTDIAMPKMSGYRLRRLLAERLAGTPLRFVALTGYGQEADRQRSFAEGFTEHMVKPANLSGLGALLRGWSTEPVAVDGRPSHNGEMAGPDIDPLSGQTDAGLEAQDGPPHSQEEPGGRCPDSGGP